MTNPRSEIYLFNLNGHEDGTLLNVFSVLDKSLSNLLQMHQVTLQGYLSLLFVLEIRGIDEVDLLRQNLQTLGKIRVHFQALPQEPPHPYILTLLESLLGYLRQQNLSVKSISSLDAEQVQVFGLKICSPNPLA